MISLFLGLNCFSNLLIFYYLFTRLLYISYFTYLFSVSFYLPRSLTYFICWLVNYPRTNFNFDSIVYWISLFLLSALACLFVSFNRSVYRSELFFYFLLIFPLLSDFLFTRLFHFGYFTYLFLFLSIYILSICSYLACLLVRTVPFYFFILLFLLFFKFSDQLFTRLSYFSYFTYSFSVSVSSYSSRHWLILYVDS